MITAAFSIVRQSMTLGCFPRLKIIQTNSRIRGQIYIPEVNYALMVLSIAAVGGFQTLDKIGSAYGDSPLPRPLTPQCIHQQPCCQWIFSPRWKYGFLGVLA